MLETLHSIGSRIRRSHLLAGQEWLFIKVEPYWQRVFGRLSRGAGFAAHINEDVFMLEYAFAARLDHRDRTVSDALRPYEPHFYQAFVQRIKEGMRVFDIGAHIGIYTLAAAKRVGCEGRVYAFEPSPQTADILERHIA